MVTNPGRPDPGDPCRDGYVRVVRSKLMYRVVFPFELKLGSTSAADGADGADASYQLFAVIVHVGSGLDHGVQPFSLVNETSLHIS